MPSGKSQFEINALCERPGIEGALWRLVKHWNPDGIKDWIREERIRGTPFIDNIRCVGSLLASAVVGMGKNSDDPEGTMELIVQVFEQELQAKRRLGVTEGGIIVKN